MPLSPKLTYMVQSFALYDCHKRDKINATSELRSFFIFVILWSKGFLSNFFWFKYKFWWKCNTFLFFFLHEVFIFNFIQGYHHTNFLHFVLLAVTSSSSCSFVSSISISQRMVQISKLKNNFYSLTYFWKQYL